jgi:hypothetical protein
MQTITYFSWINGVQGHTILTLPSLEILSGLGIFAFCRVLTRILQLVKPETSTNPVRKHLFTVISWMCVFFLCISPNDFLNRSYKAEDVELITLDIQEAMRDLPNNTYVIIPWQAAMQASYGNNKKHEIISYYQNNETTGLLISPLGNILSNGTNIISTDYIEHLITDKRLYFLKFWNCSDDNMITWAAKTSHSNCNIIQDTFTLKHSYTSGKAEVFLVTGFKES